MSVDAKKAPQDAVSHFDENAPKVFLALRSEDPAIKDIVKVRWLAKEVEGIPAGQKIRSGTSILRVGQWNYAAFYPPDGGFWPGLYTVLVLKKDKPIAEVDFSIKPPSY